MPKHKAEISETDIQDWCCLYLARVLKLAPDRINPEATFSSIGLDSAEAVFLISALEDWSGLELASDTAIEHPSVVDLARYVIGEIHRTAALLRPI